MPPGQENKRALKVRAHHLLCMQGFQGYGYNREFVGNIKKVIENIKSGTSLNVEVVDECDDICSACMHTKEGICAKKPGYNKKIQDTDRRVLEKLGLVKGARIKAEGIFSFVNKNFENISDTENICTECEWKKKCLWFSSRGNK
ncbi:MAG: DUF1284 domain-containing protein [bacterium]